MNIVLETMELYYWLVDGESAREDAGRKTWQGLLSEHAFKYELINFLKLRISTP